MNFQFRNWVGEAFDEAQKGFGIWFLVRYVEGMGFVAMHQRVALQIAG